MINYPIITISNYCNFYFHKGINDIEDYF